MDHNAEREIFISDLFSRYYPELRKMCLRRINRNQALVDAVDDVLQEVFVKAFDAYERLKDHRNIPGWLTETCKYLLSDKVKQYRRRGARHAFSIDALEGDTVASDADEIEAWVERNDVSDMIVEIYGTLSLREKGVFNEHMMRRQGRSTGP